MPTLVHPEPFVMTPPQDLLEHHPSLRRAFRDLARAYAVPAVVGDDKLQPLGEGLWQALGLDAKLAEHMNDVQGQVVSVVVESSDATIQQIPWEILHHPEHGFLGRSPRFALSRRKTQTAKKKTPRPHQKGPLRVLLFTSLPDDLDAERGRLNVEEEQAQFLEAMLPAVTAGRVDLKVPDDGRFATLKQMLREFQPHVLILSGHGMFMKPTTSVEDSTPFAVFQFETDTGGSDFVNGSQLAEAMSGGLPLECVVLSACQSAMTVPSDELNLGLAWRLSSVGIPHVIGMRESVLDRAGTMFSRTLCEVLLEEDPVDIAIQRGREAISTPLDEDILKDGENAVKAEKSLGQWCLPLLISHDHERPLLDWEFNPQPKVESLENMTLDSITLPPRFLGRRSELRVIKNRLAQGSLPRLLITGPGGQGKTSLAGRIAKDLQQDGWHVLAFSAQTVQLEKAWEEFTNELVMLLDPSLAEKYDSNLPRQKTEKSKAKLLLHLILQQTQGKLVLFLDNLEAVQDPTTLEITDTTTAGWLSAAESLTSRGLFLLATSRWRLPGWSEGQGIYGSHGYSFDGDHLSLAHSSYGDFLRMGLELVKQEKLSRSFLSDRKRTKRVYETLHGNARGLQFFAAALQGMNPKEEEAFLRALEGVEEQLQTDMALTTIVAHLSDEARQLLFLLPVYHAPVPIEGILKLSQDLATPKALLRKLVDVSLVEPTSNPNWQAREYQLSPLVGEWLSKQPKVPTPPETHYQTAAAYLEYLFQQERETFSHAILVHQALHRANQTDHAHQFALDWIVGELQLAGLYKTLLSEWLPAISTTSDDKIKATGLSFTGLQFNYLGDYDKALGYHQQSLLIRKQIGDRAGEGATLNNISQIYKARGDYDKALDFLQQSLHIAREIGDRAGEGTNLNNISQIHKARGDYDKAFDFLQQSLLIRKQIGDRAGEGTTLNNMATTAHARGDYDKALLFLQQSMHIQQQIGDKKGEGTTLNNMATTAHAQGDLDKALDFLQQSLLIQQQIGDKKGEGNTLCNISSVYQARGGYDKALEFLQQSLLIQQQIGDKAGEGTTLNNISQIYDARGDYDKALDFLQQSLLIRKEIGDVSGLCATIFNIGHIHLQKEEFQEALSAWVTVYTLARPMGLAQALDALRNLAPQLGLPSGLDGWEMLAQKFQSLEEE